MTNKQKNQKGIENYPLSKLKKNWPFCIYLARDFFRNNKYGMYSSFKEFLVKTWLEEVKFNTDYSESDSDSDDDFSSETVDSWPNLNYPGFFIEKNIVYYQESINNKTYIYSLNAISDSIIFREAARFYTNYCLKDIMLLNEKEKVDIEEYRQNNLWYVMFLSMLFSKYSSSIKKLLIEENYFQLYKTEMILTFYHVFKIIKQSEYDFEVLVNTKESSLRKRFENLFVFSDLSPNEGKELIDNFFLTKSLNEIISYKK